MSDSLVLFIAKELLGKVSKDIYSILYDRTIYVPNRFINKVLCVLLTNKIHHNTLHYKQELYGNSAKEMSLVEKCLNRKHFSDNLDFDDFCFLYNTIGNHVKVEDTLEFNLLLSKLHYPNVKIDFGDKEKFRHYIEKYIDEEDRQNTMIAGGIFSKYQNESIFAHFFPDMYEKMKNNQDIDLFIYDNGKKFIKYYEKIFEVFLENPYSKSDKINNIEEESNENYKIYQGINAFKITLMNGDKLNFIFVDSLEYPSVFSFLNTFDFSLSKIFYSFNKNAIFIPCEIFSEFNRINCKFSLYDNIQIKKIDIVDLLKNEFNNYVFLVKKLLRLRIEFFKSTNDLKLIENKLKFINANKNSLKLICNCSKMFYRIVKYGLKNFFKNNDEALDCYEQINFFYSIFKTQIHSQCFTNENIVESLFCYNKKKE
jgi:hypothetical protein